MFQEQGTPVRMATAPTKEGNEWQQLEHDSMYIGDSLMFCEKHFCGFSPKTAER